MDNRLLRWSIPGAVLMLMLFLDELLIVFVFRREHAAAVVNRHLSTGTVAFLIAVGVPLGFLMNQFYYYLSEEMGIRWPWLPVALDRGRAVLNELAPAQRSVLEQNGLAFSLKRRTRLKKGGLLPPRYVLKDQSKQARVEYREVRGQNWRAVRWLMTYGAEPEYRRVLLSSYTARSETYHALGGARYAVFTATVFCALYNLLSHADDIADRPWRSSLVIVLWLGVALALGYLLTRVRGRTLVALQESLIDGLRTALPNDAGPP